MTRILLILFLTAAPAGAAVMPHLFADEYCQLRAAGVDASNAASMAVKAAFYMDPTERQVMWRGRMMPETVLRGVLAASRLCPGLLR